MSVELMNPAVIMAIRSLELRARLIVDGFRTGLNRSNRHGFSVEFSEYRQYTQGDDPRFLDWKLFARTDRSYIRLFEDETNLRCNILLDVSRSMTFQSHDWSKWDYASTIAASLAWLLNRQGDAVGLTLYDDQIRDVVPARYRPGHFRRLLVTMERAAAGKLTDTAGALRDAAGRLQKRGLVVLISDLLSPADDLSASLSVLRSCGHDVVVLQIMDPAEATLNFSGPVQFQDLETSVRVHADPDAIRAEYVEQIEAHNREVREECEAAGAAFRQFLTDEALEVCLAEFLQARRELR